MVSQYKIKVQNISDKKSKIKILYQRFCLLYNHQSLAYKRPKYKFNILHKLLLKLIKLFKNSPYL